MNRLITLILAAGFVATTGALAQDAKLPPASDKADITYATDIKPIFDAACVKCHSGDQAKARLHMETLEGVLKGTGKAKIVTPGDAEKSELVKAVAHLSKNKDSWMPPLNNRAGIKPLTPEQIGLIIGWIKQGAK